MPRFSFQPDDKQLTELYASGLTAQALATRFGVSKKTILRHLDRLGVQRRTLRKVTTEVEAKIVQMAKSGATVAQAEQDLALEATTIRGYAAKNGVQFADRYHKGFITTWNGYRMVPMPAHPGADAKGYVREHILVAEAQLGRHLMAHEVVHHRDGDKLNNKPENLQVTTRSEHASHHAKSGETGWAKYHEIRKI